jgi:6,7-dimethyl-8-ribityllumazine synthase
MFVPTPQTDASGLRIAVVISRYHEEVTKSLAAGARRKFLGSGGSVEDLLELTVPGAFELPALCSSLANNGGIDAIVALGCVITGETRHDEYISAAVANGLVQIAVDTGVPVTFGVLTVASLQQALARAGGAMGNKGEEAMAAAIDAARAIDLSIELLSAPGAMGGPEEDA